MNATPVLDVRGLVRAYRDGQQAPTRALLADSDLLRAHRVEMPFGCRVTAG